MLRNDTVRDKRASVPRPPAVSAAPTEDTRQMVLVLAAVAAASFLLPLAVTAPAVGLPGYARDLAASASSTQWVQDGYNAMFAATVLIAGSMADKFGRRAVLVAGTALFGGCSLAISALSAPTLIVVLRIVQGLGAGGILAAGGALLASVATGRWRTTAFGVLGTSFGSGLAAGPVLAGLLDRWGWRASYLLIGLVALISLVGLRTFAPETAGDRGRRLDIAGMAAFAAAVMTLSLALVLAPEWGWSSPGTLGVFLVSLVAAVGFVQIELRTAQPLFDVRLLANRAFTTVICQPFTITFGFVILLVYVPVYLQSAAGASALGSALALLPLTMPVMLIPPAAAPLVRGVGIKNLLMIGSLCITVGAALTALGLRWPGPGPMLWPGLLVFGVGVGVAFAVMDNAAITSVPTEQAGTASGMFNTVRITGESAAISGAGALLLTLTRTGGFGSGEGLSRGAASAALQGIPVPGAGTSFTAALLTTMIIIAVLAAIGSAVSWRNLDPHRPEASEDSAAGHDEEVKT
jgi:predicted MFS family arabinose efflux permease